MCPRKAVVPGSKGVSGAREALPTLMLWPARPTLPAGSSAAVWTRGPEAWSSGPREARGDGDLQLGRGEFHPQCPSWGSRRGSLCAPARGDMGGTWGPAYLPHLPLDSGHCWAHPEPPPGRGPSTMRGCRAGSWVPGEPALGWDSGSPGRWGEGSRGRGGGWGHCGDQITCPGGPGCRDVTCTGGCPPPQAGILQQAETLEPSLPGRRASLCLPSQITNTCLRRAWGHVFHGPSPGLDPASPHGQLTHSFIHSAESAFSQRRTYWRGWGRGPVRAACI